MGLNISSAWRFSGVEKALFLRLLALGGPVMGGIFFAVLLNALDIWYISMLGATQLEAVSFALPVLLAVSHGLIGLGAGVTVTVANHMGAGRTGRAARASKNVLLLAIVMAFLLAWAGVRSIDALFTAAGAEERHMGFVVAYMIPWYSLCVPALTGMTLANAVLRGCEDTKTPAKIMGAAALINGIADPIFIFGFGPVPAHGVQGAALASALALMISCLWALVAMRRELPSPQKASGTRIRDFIDIFHVGFPAFLAQLFPPLGQFFVTALLGRGIGGEAVAGYGLAVRLETLALVFFMGISVAINIDAARRYGAEDYEGLDTLRRTSYKIALRAGLVMWLVLLVAAHAVIPFMAPDPAIAQAAQGYFYLSSIGIGAVGACICASSMLNAVRKPGAALFLYALRSGALLWPLACLGKYAWDLEGLLIGIAAANFISAVVSWLVTKSYNRL